ncbi:MAG: hypothetical protein QOF51_2089 [Chloroflexota bacterium]|jgi:phosphinothricin acetyltransferase|nr:hypothetical protein [Chloroflexota bacterium]
MSHAGGSEREVHERALQVRLVQPTDLPAIVAIYNASIPGHSATTDLVPVTMADREAWFAAHEPSRHPLWVAVNGADVVGWMSLSTFYGRAAYIPTVEASLYVHPDWQRRGVGRFLLRYAVQAAPALGIRTILAVVFAHNTASLRLLDGEGFARWGLMPRIAHMPEGRRDVVIFGLELDPDPDPE